MAKPSILTRLTKGKLIDSFEGFADTFNYLVDFIENLCGDGDHDTEKSITVDRSVPDHPIIKSSSTGSSETGTEKGVFGITKNASGAYVISNGYFMVGGLIRSVSEVSVTAFANGYAVLRVPMKNSSEYAVIAFYASWESIVGSMNNTDYILRPLYKFASDGSVEVDFRNMPELSAMEV